MSDSSGSDSRITRFKTPQIHARQGLIPLVSPIASGISMSSRDAPLVNCHISPYGLSRFEGGSLDIYDGRLDITPRRMVQRIGGKREWTRGVVSKFSHGSRRRMQTRLSAIRGSTYDTMLFLTLTYHNDWQGRAPRKDLDVYLKRLRRRFPTVAYVWRLEPQKRLAPHFHLLLFFEDRVSDAEKADIKHQWHTLVEPESDYHSLYGAKVEADLDGMEGVRVYISKYCAKVGEDGSTRPEWWQGKYWATSKNLDTRRIESLALHTEEEEDLVKHFAADYLVHRAAIEEGAAESDNQLRAAKRKARYANVVRAEGIKNAVMLKEVEREFVGLITEKLEEFRRNRFPYPTLPYSFVRMAPVTMPSGAYQSALIKDSRVTRPSSYKYPVQHAVGPAVSV